MHNPVGRVLLPVPASDCPPPSLAGFQAFADPDSGAVTAVDADMAFNSSSVRLVVVGRGPLGAFTAKVSAVQMEGEEASFKGGGSDGGGRSCCTCIV